MKKQYKIQLPKGMVVKNDAHVEITDDCIYVEAELVKEQKYEPKDGYFVRYCGESGSKNVAIFKEKLSRGSRIYCLYNTSGKYHFCTNIIDECKIRPATEEEKKLLINKLAEKGKRWNPETKTIEDVRWRADYEEEFYYVGCCGRVAKEKRTELFHYPEFDSKMRLRRIVDDDSDTQLYNVGNYFKTREAAEKVAEQIREIFKNSKEE